MGKVFDALQRAEEQRARRADEAVGAGIPPIVESAGAAAHPAFEPPKPRRSLWRRWLAFRSPRAEEDAGALNKRRIALLQPQSFVAEQFRTLRARIDSLGASQPLRTIAITSAGPGDGKTMAAVNLALVMSMGVSSRILLVDCDLRGPRVHESLGLRVEAGLAEILRGAAELEDALVTVEGTTLQVLPVRSLPPNPSELLASGRMRELVEKLVVRFDRVIFDLPPMLGLPDAKVVSDLCDGILFVVRAHVTPQDDVQSALEVVDRSRLLGIILNDADTTPDRYGYSG